MNIPAIRFFLPEDYDTVVKLLRDHEYRLPDSIEEFGGIALVAHSGEGELIGFIWSLAASGVPVAYADHFVVHRDHRKSGSVGIFMLLTLVKILESKGVTRILGVVPPGNQGYLKMLRKRGVGVYPNYTGLVVHADGEEVGNGIPDTN